MQSERFGIVLLSIVLAILMTAAAGDTTWGGVVSVALLGATLLLALRATDVHRRVRLLARIVVGAAVLAAAASALFDVGLSDWAVPTIGALLAVVAPAAIARTLIRQKDVTYQTVLGALCLYLLAGMFFALLYGAVAEVTGGPFFAQGGDGGTLDKLYFSFVTLATVGYGDLTAATDIGRMLAVTEALIGQLYLVSVVAFLISNLGARRRAQED